MHRRFQAPNTVQISTLLSIKTGACPEDCAYCPQSVRFDTGLETQELLELEEVAARARAAKDSGATRFCMGAAYRSPKPKDLRKVLAMIREVKALGTGDLRDPRHADAGTGAGAQGRRASTTTITIWTPRRGTTQEIISTRTYQDRLDTLQAVRDAGMNVCCGGIVGMGEEPQDRAELLHTLATLPEHPQSVPINQLVRVAGHPAGETPRRLDPFDFVRTIAVARILMPREPRAPVGGPRRDER